MTIKERVQEEIKWLKVDADEGKIEAFMCVRIERDNRGRIVPTLTVVAPETAAQEHIDTFFHCLRGIGEALRQVVDPPIEVGGGALNE